MRGAMIWAIWLVGCGGEGEECEGDLLVAVTVSTLDGQPVPPLISVTLDDVDCTGSGSAWECLAPEEGTYSVYVVPDPSAGPPNYEAKGQSVEVSAPEDGACEEPVASVDVALSNEAGGA